MTAVRRPAGRVTRGRRRCRRAGRRRGLARVVCGAIARVGSVAAGTSPIACSSASTNAAAVGQRSSGSLASPRASTRWAAGGRPGAGGGTSSMCARAWAAKWLAVNGLSPVSSS